MCAIRPSSPDFIDISSLSSSVPLVAGVDQFNTESETLPENIPTFVFIQSGTQSQPSSLDDFDRSGIAASKSTNALNIKRRHSADISISDLEEMKRMIQDIKSNPDLIYKKLCVRYDDSIIQKGNASMQEMQMRCNEKETVP
jgi:hypothetical protein